LFAGVVAVLVTSTQGLFRLAEVGGHNAGHFVKESAAQQLDGLVASANALA
jgi:hypothetical protein